MAKRTDGYFHPANGWIIEDIYIDIYLQLFIHLQGENIPHQRDSCLLSQLCDVGRNLTLQKIKYAATNFHCFMYRYFDLRRTAEIKGNCLADEGIYIYISLSRSHVEMTPCCIIFCFKFLFFLLLSRKAIYWFTPRNIVFRVLSHLSLKQFLFSQFCLQCGLY